MGCVLLRSTNSFIFELRWKLEGQVYLRGIHFNFRLMNVRPFLSQLNDRACLIDFMYSLPNFVFIGNRCGRIVLYILR